MLISVIIPVYNEESTIETILEQVLAIDIPKEVIVVDDGSVDRTPQIIKKFAKENDVLIYRSSKNRGKGAAVRLGLEKVKGDIVILQDADLELNPSVYFSLIEPIIKKEADIVYGSRFLNRKRVGSWKNFLANRFLTFFTNILYNVHLTDIETGYKVFKSELINKLNLKANRFDFDPEITVWFIKLGYKIKEVPVGYSPRPSYAGKKIGWRDGVQTVFTLLTYRFRK